MAKQMETGYQYRETGDLTALRTTMGDSMRVEASNGFKFNGFTDTLMKTWQLSRDSMSSIVINMTAWIKAHSVKDSMDDILTRYKEIDTYKDGRVDSANYADVNGMHKVKISYFTSHKQVLK